MVRESRLRHLGLDRAARPFLHVPQEPDHLEPHGVAERVEYLRKVQLLDPWVMESAPEMQRRMHEEFLDGLASIHRLDWREMGLDQDALSYMHLGRKERLTEVRGQIIKDLIT